jgi:hypothetical protein
VADKDNNKNEKNLSSEETKDKEKKLSAEEADNEKTSDGSKKEEKAESKSSDDKADKKAGIDDDKELLQEDDAGDLILEHRRESIPLNRENAKFTRSKGNLISLDLTNPDGTTEFFERVVIMRAFPISNPDEFLSIREPDAKRKGRGNEIGMIRRMTDFDDETQKLFLEELDRRYFSPKLMKIISVKDKFGYLYWDAETSSGNVTFIMNNPFSNIRVLDDGRIIMHDIDGNVFEIPEPEKLDSQSYKKIEIYL